MKNTGLFFFIMRTTRLIVAMFVLFAICEPAVANVAIKGMEQMAPNCQKTITDLCKSSPVGELEEVQVAARDCEVTCTYRPPGPKSVERGGVLVQNREFKKVNLPDGMPCAFGAGCDKNGKCICEFCNAKTNVKNAEAPST
uniref:Putative salp15 n=1 Tax=Ixodes ricinus TaxID=34613 RepID=A0A0K8RC69_IXORI